MHHDLQGTDDDKVVAGRALVAVLETARLVALALYPITPRLSSGIWAQLGLGGGPALGAASWDQEAVWGKLPAKHATHEPAHLFARIDVTVPFVTEPAPAAATTKSNGAKQPKVKQPKKQPQSVAS
jgi:methionyl-tRNA synthetase